jgi:hypothetical protein
VGAALLVLLPPWFSASFILKNARVLAEQFQRLHMCSMNVVELPPVVESILRVCCRLMTL